MSTIFLRGHSQRMLGELVGLMLLVMLQVVEQDGPYIGESLKRHMRGQKGD